MVKNTKELFKMGYITDMESYKHKLGFFKDSSEMANLAMLVKA